MGWFRKDKQRLIVELNGVQVFESLEVEEFGNRHLIIVSALRKAFGDSNVLECSEVAEDKSFAKWKIYCPADKFPKKTKDRDRT